MVTATQAIAWEAKYISEPGDNGGAFAWQLAGAPQYTGSAWCGAFQWADVKNLGLNLGPFSLATVMYVPSALNIARSHGLYRISKESAPGDWVIFDWSGRETGADHIGMIVANDPTKDYVTTIEGNAGAAANGQRCVAYHTRSRSLITGTVNRQSAYTLPPPPPPKPPTPTPQPTTVTLYNGVKGAAVKALQTGMMRVFPAYAGPIKSSGGADGIFGAGTEAVVKEFQRRSGLTADGVVGPKTAAALAKDGVKL